MTPQQQEQPCPFSTAGRRSSSINMGRAWALEVAGSYKMFPYIVAGSIAVYWSFVSLIPIYNKFFFDKTQYPYPIATAGIQLGLVAILLAILSVLRHYSFAPCHDAEEAEADLLLATAQHHHQTVVRRSWLFGPGMWYKIQWTAPIGILFGLKYGITNLGLALLPAPTHLLLQSTDLIWTCLAAWFINKDERLLSWVGYACIAGCVVGSAITSFTTVMRSSASSKKGGAFHDDEHMYTWWAIVVNLFTPMLLGLCIATLRLACKKLLIPCNPNLGGTTMGPFELTCWKLCMSSGVAICLACLMEGSTTTTIMDDSTTTSIVVKVDWWTAFLELPKSTRWGVMMGSLLILVFQVNCTFLTYLTSAYAVGLVGQLKIIPQWITAALIAPSKSFQLHAGNVLGAVITMVAAAVFAIHNYYVHASSQDGQEVEEALHLLGSPKQKLASYNSERSIPPVDV